MVSFYGVNLVKLELGLPEFCFLYILDVGRPKDKLHKIWTAEAK